MLTRNHAIVLKFTKRYFQMSLACNMALNKLVCRNMTQVLQRLIQLIELKKKNKTEAEGHANHWSIYVMKIFFFIL